MSKKHSILIIEDTDDLREVFVDYFKVCGYRVYEAGDGEEGFRKAGMYNPDIIILDIMMPKMDGIETCKLLKLDDDLKDIPVIFLTAKSQTSDKIKAFSIGANDFITKPCNLMELHARVKVHLKSS